MNITAILRILVLGAVLVTARVAPPPAESAESIGSTRNARVAFPIAPDVKPSERPVLTYLAGEVSAHERDELAAIAPNVRVIAGLTRQTALDHAAEAHGVDAHLITPAFLEKAGALVWVQAQSAGVDRYVGLKGLVDNERIVLTNMRAVHGPAIADHAFALLLTLTRDLRAYASPAPGGAGGREEASEHAIALQGRTMLVVGIGGIGTEIGRRAQGFGMRVIATRRTDAPAPEFVEKVGKPDDLLKMLPEADVVAICVPLTRETERMFDARALGAMKKGSYLINIARGKIVDTDALVGALKSGTLAGACLDVTDPEPLPADHPLRRMENVVITPHVAAEAGLTDERRWALWKENMRRFGAGEALLNVVDKAAGY